MNDYNIYGDSKIHVLANIAGDINIGENCRIDAFVTITGKVKLGKNVHIGTGVGIFGSEIVEIGDDTSISPGTKIFTASYDSETGYLANPQLDKKQYQKGKVAIGNRCIVGANSVVLPGVIIGDDVLIGALSLVKESVESNNTVYGIPIKERKTKCQITASV